VISSWGGPTRRQYGASATLAMVLGRATCMMVPSMSATSQPTLVLDHHCGG